MIDDLRCDETGINLELNGRATRLSWTWLRDHARDDGSFLHSAQQRIVTPAAVASAGAGTAAHTDDTLTVSWRNGPTAEFSADFLDALRPPSATNGITTVAQPWTGPEMADRIDRIEHAEIDTESGFRRALEALWREGVITLTGVPVDHEVTRTVLERFGYVRRTIFGDMWEFSSDGGFDDTASTPLEITPHTDGTYSHDAPGLLGLHCHEYDAVGGENVFVDGHTLVSNLSSTAREVLATVEIPGQYVGDGAHLMACRPALRFADDRLAQISYNHHDRAPFLLPEPRMTEVYDALHEFDAAANDPKLQFELAMRPGDMVIFDNWRVLHGRRAFRGQRLIAGGYVNREDVESTTRRIG